VADIVAKGIGKRGKWSPLGNGRWVQKGWRSRPVPAADRTLDRGKHWHRVVATRWPTKELVEDRSQGVQLATLRELARYWTTQYD
jgi:hypothetical protein